MNPLFTIGHSTQQIEEFINLLKRHRIDAVVDVRSSPYSGRFPWFSREPLEQSLTEQGIRYVFMGKELGARRDEPECYVGPRADYEKIANAPAFQEGLERLKKGLENYRIALMCAEKDPLDCHRTILVCRHALKFAEVQHICLDGGIETHEQAEARLLTRCKLPPGDLFNSRDDMLEKAYVMRGKEIAWVEKSNETEHEQP